MRDGRRGRRPAFVDLQRGGRSAALKHLVRFPGASNIFRRRRSVPLSEFFFLSSLFPLLSFPLGQMMIEHEPPRYPLSNLMRMDKKPIFRGYGVCLCHQHTGRMGSMKELNYLI